MQKFCPCDECSRWALADPIECSLLKGVPTIQLGHLYGDVSVAKSIRDIEAIMMRD